MNRSSHAHTRCPALCVKRSSQTSTCVSAGPPTSVTPGPRRVDIAIEPYVRGLCELPGWLTAMGGELEDLEDPSVGSFSSSYYISNVTFPHLPGAQGLRVVLRWLKQTQRCPQPTGGARMWP
jgi:hypothetical protein